jgi:hypothetical protein
MLTEAELTKQIRDWLDAQGIFYWKHWQGGRRGRSGRKGISDIIGSYVKHFPGYGEVGLSFSIEVKTEKGKLSRDQASFIGDHICKGKGIAIVARSLSDVIEGLKKQSSTK